MDGPTPARTTVMSPRIDARLKLRDGRTLGYAEWGSADGTPLVLLHGAPDSRLFSPDTDTDGPTSADRDVRLITLDRPGYGFTDPKPGLTVLEWVDDLIDLAGELSLEWFPVVGVSAGGPYAMAAAFRLPERVMTLGLVSSPGPPGHGLRTGQQWSDRDRVTAQLQRDPFSVVDLITQRERWIVESPDALGDPENWPEIERWVFDDPARGPRWVEGLREAARQGVVGDVSDWIARNGDWGFVPSAIKVPALLWHGEQDEIVPIDNFEYLAGAIPGARGTVWAPGGHLALFRSERWAEVLDAVTGRSESAPAG